jgi:DNA replication protein DnaC
MRLPARFHYAVLDNVPDGDPSRIVRKFWANLGTIFEPGEIVRNGWSAVFWGKNGTGKTAAASVLLKEARRRGFTCLFIKAHDYQVAAIEKERFDETETVKHRCATVDFLVIDDLSKEPGNENSSGWSERLYENLLRERCGNRKVTIITTNADKENLSSRYSPSMIQLMSESFVMVGFGDQSQRRRGQQLLMAFLDAPEEPINTKLGKARNK